MSFLSAADAFASFALTAFVLITSITELSAVLKASAASASAPSVADANELIAVVICLLILGTSKAFSTAAASLSSTLNGLKLSGSRPRREVSKHPQLHSLQYYLPSSSSMSEK